jgi:hypothetical protein
MKEAQRTKHDRGDAKPCQIGIGLIGFRLILDLARLRCMLRAELYVPEETCAACLLS